MTRTSDIEDDVDSIDLDDDEMSDADGAETSTTARRRVDPPGLATRTPTSTVPAMPDGMPNSYPSPGPLALLFCTQ